MTNQIKGRKEKIKFKENYTNSVTIWKFQKRIDKFKEELLNLKPSNGKKPEEDLLIIKSNFNKKGIR